MKSNTSTLFLPTILVASTLLLFSACERCYVCTGETKSISVDPFTGELTEEAIPDEQEFCGTGRLGTRDAVETMERNDYDCVRTD